MQFLFVGRFPEIGGSALATLPIIEALRREGHTVQLAHWVVPRCLDWFSDHDLCNLELAKQRNLLQKINYLRKRSTQVDVIISISELTPTYACQIAGWLSQTTVYAELQVHLDSWIKQNSAKFHHWLIRQLYPRLSRIRCVSSELLEYATNELGVDQSKCFVVYNGFDLKAIKAHAQAEIPKSLQPWFTTSIILCVGRLSIQKRFDLAIKAFHQAQDQLPMDARLVIVGDGPQHQELQRLIKQLDLQNKVCLTGLQANPFPFFAKASLFLLSSDYEGFGRVLIESMVCGCPIISHDCPVGPREVLQNGQCGVLTPDNSPPTLAKAMVQLMQNPKRQQQLVENGYRRCEDFEQHSLTQKYINFLTQSSTPK